MVRYVILAFFVLFLPIVMGIILYGLYIRKNILIPFKNMKDFAAKVAQGKLDEPLKMDRDNMFGAFSESFDIMREELAQAKEREFELQKKERETARAIVFDDEGYYYFSKLDTDDSDRFGKGVYIQTFGGGIEENEDVIEALNRELKEELGAEVEVIKKLGTVYDAYNLVHCNVISHYYLVRILAFGETALTGKEIQYKLSTLKLTYEETIIRNPLVRT